VDEFIPEEVRFFSAGCWLAGYLYRPVSWDPRRDEALPGVVLLQGYSSLRHIHGLEVPRLLAEEGYIALSFDHRGFGKSDGDRGRVRPLEQAQDTHDAITYLQTVEGVDPERIALYGSSFGGANALWVAAFDPRVKAVVSNAGVHDGPRWLETLHGEESWSKLRQDVGSAARLRVRTGAPTWISYPEIVPGDEQAKRVAQEHGYANDPLFVHTYDAEAVEHLLRYRPEWVANRIAPRAALIVYAEFDSIVSPSEALAVYSALGEPKRLVKLPQANHYDVYHFINSELADRAFTEVRTFLSEHL